MFAEDVTLFFSDLDFAVDATLGTAAVTGIFDAGYVDPLGGGMVAGFAPTFTLPTAEAASARRGDILMISSLGYIVRGIEPDGHGVTMLKLETE